METEWTSHSDGSLERIRPFDIVEQSPNVFDASMRQKSLSGEVAQTFDELYEAAECAYPIFFDFLRGVLRTLDIPESRLDVYTLKKRVRAAEKAKDDYSSRPDGPGLAWLYDIVRSSFVCETPEEIKRVIEHLSAMEGVVIRVKNRFAKPTPSGFRDFFINICLTVPGRDGDPVTHICELQVHPRVLKELDKATGSHKEYEFFRTYFTGGIAAVEERLRIMDEVFGRRLEGGGLAGGDPAAAGGGATSLEDVVEQVCKEGDVQRMRTLAKLVTTMCEHDLAEKINRELLEQGGRGGGESSEEAVRATDELATTKLKQGKLVEALELYEKARVGYTRLAGPDGENTLDAMRGIGIVLSDMGKNKEALEMYEKALAGYRGSLKKRRRWQLRLLRAIRKQLAQSTPKVSEQGSSTHIGRRSSPLPLVADRRVLSASQYVR
jgi:tetratricopeptide (TPR) repeat protein